MTIRLYLLPIAGSGVSPDDARRPAYLSAVGASGTMMDFGAEAVCLCAADTNDAQHEAITAETGTYSLPLAQLDSGIGAGALTAIQTWLENRNIPADWLTDGITWRELIRFVVGLFQLAQRYRGLSALAGVSGQLFPSGVNLATRLNELPTAARNRLSAAAADLGYDTAGISGPTTLRVALRLLAAQWGSRSIPIGPLTI